MLVSGSRGRRSRAKEFVSLADDRSRDFLERANNGSRMPDLKDRQIRTVVDGDRMTIMDAKCKKGSVVTGSYIR